MTVDRSKAPDIHTVQEIKPLVYQKIMLSRDIPVYLTEHGESNLFKLVLRFDGGISDENKSLEAQLAARMLLEGTSRKSAEEIALLLDFFGASIKTIAERDYISVKVQGLRKDFQGIMDVVMELIHDSVLPEKEFLLLKSRIHNQFKTNIQRKSYQAQNEIKPLLFGTEHAYGHSLSEAVFNQLTLDDVKHYYKRAIQNGHLRIFISGIEAEEAETFLNNRTGNLLASEYKALTQAVFPTNKRRVLHIQHDNAVQSAIRL
ncbi:MAG: M16 family metallopeptidase, partial [Bacteroidota bacterium]